MVDTGRLFRDAPGAVNAKAGPRERQSIVLAAKFMSGPVDPQAAARHVGGDAHGSLRTALVVALVPSH
jgi:hypothetical protein